ncbi:helix-turn-helix domain-containing protein [Niameybacter massiliensis]|uniref:helix-turn-helix domain-containing protein n=1 Tax=Niameybacter massiliensis TaxID=1658108 RepID=UPI0018E25977|nr:helix-turn-helix transcriptional regulator [Niameybacter massiliensis]
MKYRKESSTTQAALAEYLGVSPQAVSKWEQELSVPDVYLLPKIARFFNISIDTLFGNTELSTAEALTSKYTVQPNDKHYKEAIQSILSRGPKNTEGLKQLIKLENYRAHEFLKKGQVACQELLEVATDQEDIKSATIQLIRTKAMLGDLSFVESYVTHFESTQTAENFNYLLRAIDHLPKPYGSSLHGRR